MAGLPKSIQNLINELNRLPGIGPKTAGRLTFYLLTKSEDDVRRLAKAVEGLRANLVTCKVCFNIAESDPCEICDNEKRDRGKVCVVEEPLDVMALERTGYDGLYHILGGVISPINGIGPGELRIAELLDRVKSGKVKEIILASDPSLEGEATAMYIAHKVSELKRQKEKGKSVVVTRIARGLPMGGDLEYADEVTLTKALEGRMEY